MTRSLPIPDIAMKFSIGQSYEGREIWGIKISDNVATDENEPEVFIHGLTHARERTSNEEALSIIQHADRRATTRTRASRRSSTAARSGSCPCSTPTAPSSTCRAANGTRGARTASPSPDSTEIGIDLNRNWGYTGAGGSGTRQRWQRQSRERLLPRLGAGGRARGAGVRALRGEPRRQRSPADPRQHRLPHRSAPGPVAVLVHAQQTCPRDMTRDDHAAFVALGQRVAALNGYKPQQGSDLYPVSRRPGRLGVPPTTASSAYTIEMSKGAENRYYPTQAELGADITANRDAVLTFLEFADCPYRAAASIATAGRSTTTSRWRAAGRSTRAARIRPRRAVAARRAGRRRRPAAASSSAPRPPSGMADLVTGAAAGSDASANDIDGGVDNRALAGSDARRRRQHRLAPRLSATRSRTTPGRRPPTTCASGQRRRRVQPDWRRRAIATPSGRRSIDRS